MVRLTQIRDPHHFWKMFFIKKFNFLNCPFSRETTASLTARCKKRGLPTFIRFSEMVRLSQIHDPHDFGLVFFIKKFNFFYCPFSRGFFASLTARCKIRGVPIFIRFSDMVRFTQIRDPHDFWKMFFIKKFYFFNCPFSGSTPGSTSGATPGAGKVKNFLKFSYCISF